MFPRAFEMFFCVGWGGGGGGRQGVDRVYFGDR